MATQASKFVQCRRFDGTGGADRIADEAIDDGRGPAAPLWVHFDLRNKEASEWAVSTAGLPKHAVDVLLAGDTRPRSAVFEDGLLVVLRGVNMNPGSEPEDMVSIRVWIDEHGVVSSRRRRLLAAMDIAEALEKGEGPTGPGAFLPNLVERLADRIGDFVDTIEARLDSIEDATDEMSVANNRARLAPLRRQIAEVRRFLAPQRDALDRLTRQSISMLSEADIIELRQEADRITRHLEDLDLVRERTIVLQEELLGRIAQEQNSRMYVLSIVAAIFLPLTFVTGLLGMNVGGLPGLNSDKGFIWSVVVMVIAAVALLGLFRSKKWF